MTFQELDEHLRTHVEQLGFDQGCAWVEEFRDERGRDPEPEECDEEAAAAADRLAPRVRRFLEASGVSASPALLAEARRVLSAQFVEALEL